MAMRSGAWARLMWRRRSLICSMVRAVPMGRARPRFLRCRGDRVGVDRAFDEDGQGAGGERVAGFRVAKQCLALGEDGGVLGVEVLRAGVVIVGLGGVALPDEPDHRCLTGAVGVMDRHDESVAEHVDVVAGAVATLAGADESGLLELLKRGTAIGEMGQQAAGSGRRVALVKTARIQFFR
jgi:hypothetical protein